MIRSNNVIKAIAFSFACVSIVLLASCKKYPTHEQMHGRTVCHNHMVVLWGEILSVHMSIDDPCQVISTDTLNEEVITNRGEKAVLCPVSGVTYLINPNAANAAFWQNLEDHEEEIAIFCPEPHFERDGNPIFLGMTFGKLGRELKEPPAWVIYLSKEP